MIISIEFNDIKNTNMIRIKADSYTFTEYWLIVHEPNMTHYFGIDNILHVVVDGDK